jgi:hypothetical protein
MSFETAMIGLEIKFSEHFLDLSGIHSYLQTHEMDMNRYRIKVNAEGGRSVCFGMVYKRCNRYGYSRQNAKHPELWKMIMEYAEKHVKIPWCGVQVNQNYRCQAHKDVGNYGESYIVGFGAYTGGDLILWKNGKDIHHDIQYKPLLFNGSQITHSTQRWLGTRYSLVFFDLDYRENSLIDPGLNRPVLLNGKWVLITKETENDDDWKIRDRTNHVIGTYKETLTT